VHRVTTTTIANGKTNGTARRSVPRWAHTLQKKRIKSTDGTHIAYEVVGQGRTALVIANGLGGRLHVLEPILDAFWQDHRIVTWDYRGLFESETPDLPHKLSVAHHAEDLRAIMAAEGIDRAVLFGWSMGVQIALDFAASHPRMVSGLVLANGTHGHAFSSGFQPFFAIPGLPKRLHSFVEWTLARPEVTDTIARITHWSEWPTTMLMLVTCGRRAMELRPLLRRYYDDVLGPSFPNFMRLFQELDAHSAYHLLPDIAAPALVISGKLDFLTPSFQSDEMARRMPNAEHVAFWRASHFALHERTSEFIEAMRRFLDRRVAH
jgi:pimeloyl-ACP methyl ester carboxylesterase